MKTIWVAPLAILALSVPFQAAHAADHADGPRASADPSADITDVFAWMSPDARMLNLVMALTRNATTASRFSDGVQYVFHTSSAPSFGARPSREVDIICVFKRDQMISCRVVGESRSGHGDDDDSRLKVKGDASQERGIESKDGRLKVFAGLRDDAFYFNLAGFRATGRIVAGAASGLTFDGAGCPTLDAATSAALVNQLKTAPGGGPAVDNFARFNVLAIVVSIDKSVLTRGGPILGVWGSTNRRNVGHGRRESADDHRQRGGDDDDMDLEERQGRLGVQIDRMGRPGVNTALTNPFYRETVPAELAAHEVAVDAYNAATNPADWPAMFTAEIAANLAILDGLDRVCGNQLLAGPSPVAGRYNRLAAILADDQLYVNSTSGSCNQYLGVEANAVGISNSDCGGRTPLEDTIDTTFSLLAAGVLSGVADGISVDADGAASLTVFPFLSSPN